MDNRGEPSPEYFSKSESNSYSAPADQQHWLIGGGEMGKLVRSTDWSNTALGPIELWPQSLRTTVSLVLSSSFPISLAWGPRHIQIYNDGYWPICGEKHPSAIGQDFTECWASAWPAIGDAFERALRGETSFLENQWMFLDRNGYLEETCFTFSFSPIRDESGGIGGLFHPVTEVTAKLISERRISAVRDVMVCAAAAHSVEDALILSARTMSQFQLDLPFAMFYCVNACGTEARLVASTKLLPAAIAAPLINLELVAPRAWPLREVVLQNHSIQVEDLPGRFGPYECGPYPEAPKQALIIPIRLPGSARPEIILVAAASSRLPFDQAYHAFYDLLAGTIASAAATASAYEEERKRAEALAEMDRAKTEFFSNVSHEFRTPLTLMLGPLEDELAEISQPLPADRIERLETVHRNSMRLLRLVNTLLDFSRMEAGRMQAQYEATDLANYTSELASNFRSAVEKGNLALFVDCPPLPEPIFVDRQMWEKIVLNLLSNAFKHTFRGSIRVSLECRDDSVELSVTDTGTGISATELPHLFERFHRVQNAQSRTHEGTGIGLALVQGLIKSHGGSIRVESQEGKGSTFYVNLPTGSAHLPPEMVVPASTSTPSALNPSSGSEASIIRPATPIGAEIAAHSLEASRWIIDTADHTVDEPVVGQPAAKQSSKLAVPPENPVDLFSEPHSPARTRCAADRQARPKILWADDNRDMREYVLRLLSEQYDVIAVPDGLAAVQAALADPPDLVLTDVMMPRLDGFGLLKALRNDPQTQMTPVILLSARAGQEASLEGIAAGADDYLMKPFSARELMARIGTHLRAAKLREQWAAAIELREQRLALTSQELKRSNDELQQFAYIASHDLQEPLRTVTSFTQLLSKRYKGRLDADADEFIAFAVDGCIRMKSLIRDLLTYSRAGASTEPFIDVAASEALEAALTNLHIAIEESDAIVTSDPLPLILTDGLQLAQVFQNLIGNAIKYRSDSAPRIHVSAKANQQEWIFSVTDNGRGIEDQHFDRIFVLFQRLQEREEGQGTGIGLSICKKVVEHLGGRIWVESTVDAGSTFHFALPGSRVKQTEEKITAPYPPTLVATISVSPVPAAPTLVLSPPVFAKPVPPTPETQARAAI